MNEELVLRARERALDLARYFLKNRARARVSTRARKKLIVQVGVYTK